MTFLLQKKHTSTCTCLNIYNYNGGSVYSEHYISVCCHFLSLQYFGDVSNRKRLVILSSLCTDTTLDLIFSMNGDMPHVPITTLAGIASLTDCKCNINFLMLFIQLKHSKRYVAWQRNTWLAVS